MRTGGPTTALSSKFFDQNLVTPHIYMHHRTVSLPRILCAYYIRPGGTARTSTGLVNLRGEALAVGKRWTAAAPVRVVWTSREKVWRLLVCTHYRALCARSTIISANVHASIVMRMNAHERRASMGCPSPCTSPIVPLPPSGSAPFFPPGPRTMVDAPSSTGPPPAKRAKVQASILGFFHRPPVAQNLNAGRGKGDLGICRIGPALPPF